MDLTHAYLTIGVLFGLWISALAAAIALGAYCGRAPAGQGSTVVLALRITRVLLLTLAVLLTLLALLAMGGIVLIILLGIVGPMIAIQGYRAQRDTILGLLTTSLGRGIPVEVTLAAFAGQLGPLAEQRADQLSMRLRDGEPLLDALRTMPGLIPRDALPLLAVSLRSGSAPAGPLPNRLLPENAATGVRERLEAARYSLAGKALYLLGVLPIMLGILAFMLQRIVPSFLAICEDFDMASGPMARWLGVGSDFVELSAAPLMLLVFFLFIYGVLRLGYGVPWDLPGMGRLLRPLDAANVLDAVSIGVEHGRPLPETIETVAETYPKRRIRRRLREVQCRVTHGADWIDGLLAAHLLRPAEASALRTAAAAGNLPWAMRAVAESGRRRFANRVAVALQVAFPLLIVALAAVVTLFVFVFLVPMLVLPMQLV